jgi:hypothetical protein
LSAIFISSVVQVTRRVTWTLLPRLRRATTGETETVDTDIAGPRPGRNDDDAGEWAFHLSEPGRTGGIMEIRRRSTLDPDAATSVWCHDDRQAEDGDRRTTAMERP